MTKDTISEAALLRVLVDETGKLLAVDASYLGSKIMITHQRDEFNWTASIGMVGLATSKAFDAALQQTQLRYDLDWRSGYSVSR